MRAGKSLPIVIHLRRLGLKALIVAPLSAIKGWEETLAQYPPEGEETISLLPDSQLDFKKKDKLKKIFMENYEILVIDELHRFRNNSLRFQALRFLTKTIKYRYGLSATLFDKDLSEMFYPMQLLDGGEMFGKNRQKFYYKYCMRYDEESPWLVRPEKEQELRSMILKQASVIKPKELVMPARKVVKFKVSEEQKKYMRTIDENCLPDFVLKEIDVFKIKAKDLVIRNVSKDPKKMQILGGFFLWKDLTFKNIIESYKWLRVKELVDFLMKNNEKIIIWVRFLVEYEILLEVLKEYRVLKFSSNNLDIFDRGEADIILCHTKSAGAGVNISSANHAIYVTESRSGIDAVQSSARMTKVGNTEAKTLWFLSADNAYGATSRKVMADKINNIEGFYGNEII